MCFKAWISSTVRRGRKLLLKVAGQSDGTARPRAAIWPLLSCLPLAATMALGSVADAGLIYGTDFEGFDVGNNKWAGREGWQSNDNTSGAQGIVENFVPNLPLGKTAYLGYNPPTTAFTTVSKIINYDPATTGLPIVAFDSFLGIQDSTFGARDRFYISFYNIAGDFIASICFDNTDGKIYRETAEGRFATGIQFIRGNQLVGIVSLQLLDARIDLANNRWSASLDGIPLFVDAVFSAGGGPQDLGATAAEWEIAKTSPSLAPGNNWLFVADWFIRSVPVGIEPFTLSAFNRAANGAVTLAWPGQAGFDYTVEYSDDCKHWHRDLPGSAFPAIAADGTLEFGDPNPPPLRRFYRILRKPSP